MADGIKLVIVGAGAVGKSALTLQFMYDEFIEDYEPTKADSYRKKLTIDNEEIQVDILDTAGQEDYHGIQDGYFRSGEGFMFVFDVCDVESLNKLTQYHNTLLRVKQGDPCLSLMVVANKIDLKKPEDEETNELGRKKAEEFSASYMETSAKSNTKVEEAFVTLIRAVRAKKLYRDAMKPAKEVPKKKKKCTLL